mgnify:CR=1 FL=1
MKEGSAGPDVSLIEVWLNDRSQLYCEEDYVADNAVFGPEDTATVKETQQRAGLETNGVVDRPTWAALRARAILPATTAPRRMRDGTLTGL